MNNQFVFNPEKFANAISNTTLEDCVKRHDDKYDAFTGVGIGISYPTQTYQVKAKQTFIVHNGEVYIRSAAIESGTIKTK